MKVVCRFEKENLIAGNRRGRNQVWKNRVQHRYSAWSTAGQIVNQWFRMIVRRYSCFGATRASRKDRAAHLRKLLSPDIREGILSVALFSSYPKTQLMLARTLQGPRASSEKKLTQQRRNRDSTKTGEKASPQNPTTPPF
jgi:hypothetical protein